MVKTHWEDLRGRDLRYSEKTWELTGDLEVRENGELLAVEARRTDDVRHETAILYFGMENPTHSLNPGNLGEHFNSIERRGNDHYILVKKEQRTHQYKLKRMRYE